MATMTAEQKKKKRERDKAYRQRKKAGKAAGDTVVNPDPEAVPNEPSPVAEGAGLDPSKDFDGLAEQPEAEPEAKPVRFRTKLQCLPVGSYFEVAGGTDPFKGRLLDLNDSGAKVKAVRGGKEQDIWWSSEAEVFQITDEEFNQFFKVVEEKKKEAITKARARSAEKASDLAPINKKPTTRGVTVFGHPVRTLIRWMGQNGYTVVGAKKFAEDNKLTIAHSSIVTYLCDGKSDGVKNGRYETISDEAIKGLTPYKV